MSALTVANQLTLLRMLLIPALVILVLYGNNGWALVVFIVAGVTDGLDGMLARWWGQRTSLGALLDPMADKLLVLSTFVVLSLPELDLPNQFPVWLTVLVISRDVIIVVTAAIATNDSAARVGRSSARRGEGRGALRRAEVLGFGREVLGFWSVAATSSFTRAVTAFDAWTLRSASAFSAFSSRSRRSSAFSFSSSICSRRSSTVCVVSAHGACKCEQRCEQR